MSDFPAKDLGEIVLTKLAKGSVNDTVAKLSRLVEARGLTLFALDLPLKVLVWDDRGQTKVSYTAPAVLAERYHLTDELADRLAGIGPITDALVAS